MSLRLRFYLAILATLTPTVFAVAGTPDMQATQRYPVADANLGEQLYPDEELIAKKLADVVESTIRKQFQDGSARRDAHPKAHGCLKAEFMVDEKIPENLAKGVFIPGKTYQAWIRYSNGNPDPNKPDYEGQERGMSIKLLGVPGDKLLESEQKEQTQDFIMMSNPAFFLRDPGNAVPFFEVLGSGSKFTMLKIPFALSFSETRMLLKINALKISNPFQTRYWSPVPYQLGASADKQAIKFSARSCTTNVDSMPDKPGANFLRDAMRITLAKGDVCMEFLVQPRTSATMAVEDAKTEWDEADAPFFKVATIRIPQQTFEAPDRQQFCENLSFTPWHALPEHKPLGGINRLRKVVYERLSSTRHAMNNAERREP
jgi:hypothetical protein